MDIGDKKKEGAPIALLLKESGFDSGFPYRVPPEFLIEPPKRLKADEEWEWRTLTHALIHASHLFEDRGAKDALLYLERTFPNDFSISRLMPLAAEALAEIVNLWGACYRRQGELATAMDLFGTALRLTKRASIRQYAHYNRGYSRLQMGMRESDPRLGDAPARHVVKQLVEAEKDLATATELDPTDSAAWSQRGLAGLLLASMTTMTVGKRLRWYQGASAAYEKALEHESKDNERTAIESNLKISREGIAAMSKSGWLKRTFGRSAEIPGSIDETDAIAAAQEAEQLAARMDLVARAKQIINQPIEEEDEGKRERDPRVVAEHLIRTFDDRSGDSAGQPAFAFVEAVWFLLQSGATLPELRQQRTHTLAELTQATHARDSSAMLEILEKSRDKKWQAWLWNHVDGLVGRHFPVELAEFCLQYGVTANVAHMEALGAKSSELSHELLLSLDERRNQVALTLPALLAAMDYGADTAQLERLWTSLRPANLEEDATWANGEIRRLSRVDLAAASSFREEVLTLHNEEFDAALAFFSRLARQEGKSALVVGLRAGPPGAIALPRVIGCALGGVIIPDAMNAFLGELDKNGYAPHILFGYLIEFCLRNDLPELLAQVLDQGGAHGWQVAQAAGPVVRLPAVREADKAGTMLNLLLKKHRAGPVAGRDASDNRPHAGQCEYRPVWLDFDVPKPVEWLVLMAALEDDAPWWRPLNRPLP